MADQAEKFAPDPTAVWSQCVYCTHKTKPSSLGLPPSCKAFPGAIPDEILANKADHRKPYDGDDQGMGEPGEHVLFEPRPDVDEVQLKRLYAALDKL